MNKALLLVLIPCLVAFVVAQYPGFGYGGPAVYGGGYGPAAYRQYGVNSFYYNYGLKQQKQSTLFAFFIAGIILLLAANITGGLSG